MAGALTGGPHEAGFQARFNEAMPEAQERAKERDRRIDQEKRDADELDRLEWAEVEDASRENERLVEKRKRERKQRQEREKREAEQALEELPSLQLAVPEAQNRLEAAQMNLAERLFGGAPQRYAGTDWARQVEGQGADFGRKQNELTQAHLEVARSSLTHLETIAKRDRAVAVLSR